MSYIFKMQNSKLQLKIQKYLIIAVLVFAAMPVFAAEVSFDTKTQEIKVNQLFEVGVFINTDEESINAIEGKITFPRDLLEVKKVNDGNSIINFWIEKPKNASDGQIAFSGITPGGYNDSQGLIFSITFLAKKEGNGAIKFGEVKALRNDGQGTEAALTISNFQFLISVPPAGEPVPQITTPKTEDLNPPEEFTPQIAADPVIFKGEWFLVFATQDKGSGIDYYEILETRSKIQGIGIGQWLRRWKEAESPYLLKDQNLRSFIYVKAIDKAGNERIVRVEPGYPVKWYKRWEIWFIIILGVVIVYAMSKFLWKRLNTKNHE